MNKSLLHLIAFMFFTTVALGQVKDTTLVRTVSGALTQIPGSRLRHMMPQNIKSVLQGLVPGLHVVQSNGQPGSEATLRLRGTSSVFAESEPLYVIDGVPVFAGPREMTEQGTGGNWGAQYNPLTDFNIEDIAMIEVLKDAAATAIYGARGANGVILITTKKGERNRQQIDINFYSGISEVTNALKTLNAREYLQLLDESWANSGGVGNGPLPAIPGFDRAVAARTNTDHMAVLLDHGVVTNLSMSASSASNGTNFYVSGSYRNEEGVLQGNNLTRYTGRMKISNQILRRLNIGINLGVYLTDYEMLPVGNSVGGGFNAAQSNLPVYPLVNPNGTYFNPFNSGIYNLPGSNIEAFQHKKYFNNEEHTSRFFLAGNFRLNIARNMDFSTEAAMERYFQKRANYLGKQIRLGSAGSGLGREGVPTAYAAYEKYSNNLFNGRSVLSYKSASDTQQLSALTGFEYFYNENPMFFAEGEGFANDFTRDPGAAQYKDVTKALSLVANTTAFIGYFGNLNYSWKNRYLASATVRVDGSSRYGANHKYVTSPAASLGWMLSEEDFLKPARFINMLKIRGSYGRTWNSGIGNYSARETWSLTPYSRYLLQAGIQMQSLGSPDLKPERQEQLNVGVDFSILNNRISGSIDVYNRITKDMLLGYNVPLSVGVARSQLLMNGGAMRNRGLEAAISSKNLLGPVKWNTELSIATNKNRITDLGGLNPQQLSINKNIITALGHAVGTFYLARHAGIDPATGQELIYDIAGNKVVASSAAQIDAARVAQKDKPSAPKVYGGLNNTLSYKQFDLNAFFTFSLGNYVLDEGERDLSYLKGSNNLRAASLERWTPQHTASVYPRLFFNDPLAGSNTTRFLHNASYLRLKNITLGYTFGQQLKKVKFIKGARAFIAAQNLLTMTKFKGWDPEVTGNYSSALERNINQGITYMDLPQVRTLSAGLNLNF